MSFLREIIASAEEIEIKNLKQRIPELKSEIHFFKAELLKYFDEVYVEYLRNSAEIPQYCNKLIHLQEELNIMKLSLQDGIKKELVCIDDLNNFNEYVQDIDIILLEMKELCCFHGRFLDVNFYYSTQNYLESLKVLKEVESIMKNNQSLIMLKYFQESLALQKSSMFLHFGELINTTFFVSLMEQGNTSFLKFENNFEVNNLIQHLYLYNNHIRALDKLIDFLWEFVFVPTITCIVKLTINECELTVVVTKRHSKQNYNEVFKKLYKVNYFLQSYLNLNLSESDNVTLLEYIGNQLKDKFSPLLIGHCLQKICLPGEGDNLDYDKIIEDTDKLLNELKFLKIISDNSILEYATNLKQIHVNKQCDLFFNHAKILMNQKSTEITQVGTLLPNSDVDNMSDFPIIAISSIAQEVLQLVEKILMEMKGSSSTSCTRLFQTVLGILEYYMKNGRRYQEEMMAQQVALFHNNCKYIAYELEEWNIFYSDIFQGDKNIPIFKNEPYQLQTIADETLNISVSIQRNKLRSILMKNDMEITERLWELSEKPIRKCFLQIKYLKDAWCNILSRAVYNKSMGILINVLCDYFTKFILKLGVFETKNKQKLSEIFNFIEKNAPLYFLETDLKIVVDSWEKLTSISFILNSNLIEIETNWCSRGSFLKFNLKTNEMEVLVKSLFEDSQKRATIVSKIHD